MDETKETQKTNQEILDEWKAEKKAKKELNRTRFNARPLWQRILIIAGSIILVLGIILAVIYLVAGEEIISSAVMDYYFDNIYAYETMDLSEIRKDVVIDEEAAAEVDAMEKYGKDDTWGIYIYMVGSNLESMNENDLSDMVKLLSTQEAEENQDEINSRRKQEIQDYTATLADAGMEMPSPMYSAVKPEASSTAVTNDVIVAERDGAAWMDIEEILKADLSSDKLDIVIQTGGAKRWSNSYINPNRVQIFQVKNRVIIEEESYPTFSMGTGEAIADFLSYCEKNHDADHKIVIFWNHGGASTGFGHDEIFNETSSLKEMQAAFEKVYGKNPSEAPFELIGFDACLMSSAEVFNILDGYGKYLAASEETEPGYGWYYTKWLSALSQDPSMNGAQVGKLIADDYMDFYKAQDIKLSLFSTKSVCFTISDINEGKKTYEAYKKLVHAVLRDTADDPEALTELCRGAHESIHYCGSAYDTFNTVDLGIIADHMEDRYPKESAAIEDGIKQTVLYNRTANNMDGSKGINVYFPDTVTSYTGMIYALDYINTISDDKVLSALYFYKNAGCLSDEMRSYLRIHGYKVPRNINTAALEEVEKSDVIITEEGNFSLTVSEEARKYIQEYRYNLGVYDTDEQRIVDYGHDRMAQLDAEGNLRTVFSGKWICLEGQPLATSIIQSHNGIVTYRSPILLDGKDAYLIYTYNEQTDEFTITGAYLKSDEIEGDFVSRNVSDLKPRSIITPAYECQDVSSKRSYIYGDEVRYGSGTTICYDTLKNGTYCSAITFTDVRGDEFDSDVVTFDVRGGELSNTMQSSFIKKLDS